MASIERQNLLGIDPEFDEILHDFAYLASRHREFHPANAGDVSQVLERNLGQNLLDRFETTASAWYEIESIEQLAELRNDGRTGYRSEGIKDPAFYEQMKPLSGRLMLITRTGAELPSLEQSIKRGQDGKLINVVEIDETGKRIRIVYGNAQYGSIPSIETHLHMATNGMGISEGEETPATVHTHPYHLVALGRDRRIAGNFGRFNVAIYTAVEGINRNHPDLIAVSEYFESGTQDLVTNSIQGLRQHKLILWMNHGFAVRATDIRRSYTLTDYAEASAKSALDSLRHGSVDLPSKETMVFLQGKGLVNSHDDLAHRTRKA